MLRKNRNDRLVLKFRTERCANATWMNPSSTNQSINAAGGILRVLALIMLSKELTELQIKAGTVQRHFSFLFSMDIQKQFAEKAERSNCRFCQDSERFKAITGFTFGTAKQLPSPTPDYYIYEKTAIIFHKRSSWQHRGEGNLAVEDIVCDL
ncbi:hypothetical protein TcasGA2_TC013549 [Tribolium castaneum]|uniref:Uncharacterized protein n=1 Tax=Tribolium castaneum TaxID=7070 RepID=D6WKY1_TRICA|nr:hypothetical protein TcasGA2_TC013549 [Tribolium castaneum]